MISTRSFGRAAKHFLSSIDTAVVLPTPVDPITAKCRLTSSSMLTEAGTDSFWVRQPISTPSTPRKL